MKTTSLVSILPFLASAQATGLWWGSEECYTAPENTNNECTEQQQTGFNWDDLDIGDFSSFGGLDFSGFSCSSGFGGLRTRTYNNKCITGNIGKGGITKSSAPSISCGQDKPGFSIDKFHLFTSVETDVTISFGMPDGSTCKKTSSCNSAGTEVTNDQCGGAVSVGFELPDHSDHDDCDFGIGSIGFICGPGKPTYTPPAETPSSTETPTPDLPASTPISIPLIPTQTPTMDTPSVQVPTATPTGSSPVTSSAPIVPPTTSYSSHSGSSSVPFTLSTVYTTSVVTITQCASTVTDCPASSTQTTTSTILVSTTWCPVTPTETSAVPTESSSDLPPPPVETETSETPAPPVPTETPSSPATITPTIPTSVHPGSSSVPSAPEESVTTEITYTTVTWCPVTDTITSGESTFTTVTTSTWDTTTLTSTTTICGGCTVTDIPAPPETPAVPTETSTLPTETPDVPTGVQPTETPEAPETTPEAPASTVTEVTYTTVTTCPVTETITTGESTITTTYSTVSTQTLTSSSTIVVPTDVLPTETPAPTSDVPGQTVTEITYTTITTCPVTETVTSGESTITTTYSTVSTQTLTSTSTIPAVPTSVSPEETEAPTTPEETTSTPIPTSSCPNVVPKCINTWLNLIPDCKSNSDVSCFCPNDEFIDKVINCVQAWGASEDEVQSALSYLTGICANFVPENPGIITHVPTTITLTPPAAPTPTDVSPEQSDVPESPAPTSAPCTTITYSTYTVTVPQVEFSTATVTETAGAGGATGVNPVQTPTIELIPQPPTQATSTGVDATGGSTTVPNPWTGGAGTTLATNTPSPTVTPFPAGPVFTGAASPLRVPMTWLMALAVPVLAL